MSLTPRMFGILSGNGTRQIITDDGVDMEKVLANVTACVKHYFPFQNMVSEKQKMCQINYTIVAKADFDMIS